MVDTEEYMLTTIDNPFSPFTQWDEWRAWDEDAGYYTPAYLARIAKSSDELSDVDQGIAIDNAIDEIIKENLLDVYRKVTKSDYAVKN